MQPTLSRQRAGMTLIEVMVALVILAGSLVAMGNFMGKFTHTQRIASLRQDAIDIATDVLDSAQHDSSAAALTTDFQGTVNVTRDGATFSRATTVKQLGSATTGTYDYYIVTTVVTPPANLARGSSGSVTLSPIKKTIVIHN
jgi:prepilin-type N-terminal cleavage/methylation domain-containing protein